METRKLNNGEVRFKEKVRLPSGRIRTKTFRRKTDANAWKRNVESEKTRGILGIQDVEPVPFGEIASRWLKRRAESCQAPRTMETYKSSLDAHVLPVFQGVNIAEITVNHLEALKSSLVKKSLQANSINRVFTMIRQVMLLAQSEGFLKEIPVRSSLFMKQTKKPFSYYEELEVKALLRASRDKPIYPILYLALYTGMRRGEILGLCWDRLNLNAGKIEITRTLHRKRRLQQTTKSGRSRYFPLSDELRAFFLELRKTQKSPQFIFTDEKGVPFDPMHFCERDFKEVCNLAGVRTLRFHDLRHTFASHFMMNGGSIFDLKELLGHSDFKTTLIYAHLSPNHLREASRIINFGESFGQSGATGPSLAPAVQNK